MQTIKLLLLTLNNSYLTCLNEYKINNILIKVAVITNTISSQFYNSIKVYEAQL
jgi:hypothetical protein